MPKEKILGVTTITAGYRISILKDVRQVIEKSSGEELKEGDRLVYYVNRSGDIVIRKA